MGKGSYSGCTGVSWTGSVEDAIVGDMIIQRDRTDSEYSWLEEKGLEPRKSRRWQDKFAEAFRGIKLGIRGHSSFFVHFFFATLAIAAAIALECTLIEWCLILFCIGGVITAELFNSAIETLFHGLDESTKARWNGCLEIAAGAVLVAAITASVVGGLIFTHRLIALFG